MLTLGLNPNDLKLLSIITCAAILCAEINLETNLETNVLSR